MKRDVDGGSLVTGMVIMAIIAILVWGISTLVVPQLGTAGILGIFYIVGQGAAVLGIFYFRFGK